LLATGNAAEIDKLLGPRGYQEETQEALEAVGLPRPEAPMQGTSNRDCHSFPARPARDRHFAASQGAAALPVARS